jgi:hypothetical protein
MKQHKPLRTGTPRLRIEDILRWRLFQLKQSVLAHRQGRVCVKHGLREIAVVSLVFLPQTLFQTAGSDTLND